MDYVEKVIRRATLEVVRRCYLSYELDRPKGRKPVIRLGSERSVVFDPVIDARPKGSAASRSHLPREPGINEELPVSFENDERGRNVVEIIADVRQTFADVGVISAAVCISEKNNLGNCHWVPPRQFAAVNALRPFPGLGYAG